MLFTAELGDSVGAEGLGIHGFGFGKSRVVAVDGG